MSLAQCRRCRLSLEASIFGPAGELEEEAYRCEIDENFPAQYREGTCAYYIAWDMLVPPPSRSCKKSEAGTGCGIGGSGKSCGTCGTSAGGGGCGESDDAVAGDPMAQYDDDEAGYEFICSECQRSREQAFEVMRGQ